MGYGKYWNFEHVMAKAQAWVTRKGYHLGEHFVEFTEMAELGSGAVREVTNIKLSRAACMDLSEYEKFRVIQDREIMSDFDRQLKILFDDNEHSK